MPRLWPGILYVALVNQLCRVTAAEVWSDLSSVTSEEWLTFNARIGASAASNAAKDAGIVWGGASIDTYTTPLENVQAPAHDFVAKLDSSWEWSEVELAAEAWKPDLRQFHKMCGPLGGDDSSHKNYVIFGGQVFGTKLLAESSDNTVLVLHASDDLSQAEWRQVPTTGDTPAGRLGHAAACGSGGFTMYLFGGYRYLPEEGTPTTAQLDDLVMLQKTSDQSFEWSLPDSGREVITGDRPGARYEHSLDWFESKLVMFGGVVRQRGAVFYLDETWILEAPSPAGLAAGEDLQWVAPFLEFPGAVRPSARAGHATVAVGSELVLFGGHAIFESDERHITIFDDLWLFDTDLYTWTQLAPSGATTNGWSWHSALLVNSAIISLGGIVLFEADNGDSMSVIEPQIFRLDRT
mmetsp:Transcript_19622/g.36285  ORF Transcript_19622/g.36285 Transcript_19622/m.36285 type:complete len:408 (-) Transcript_19622:48-1271(-)